MEKNVLVINANQDQRFTVTSATTKNGSKSFGGIQDGVFDVSEYAIESASNGMEWWNLVATETVHFLAMPYYNKTESLESMTNEMVELLQQNSMDPEWINEAEVLSLMSAAKDMTETTIFVVMDELFLDDALPWARYASSIIREAYDGTADPAKIVMVTRDANVKKEDWPGCEFVVLCPTK